MRHQLAAISRGQHRRLEGFGSGKRRRRIGSTVEEKGRRRAGPHPLERRNFLPPFPAGAIAEALRRGIHDRVIKHQRRRTGIDDQVIARRIEAIEQSRSRGHVPPGGTTGGHDPRGIDA